jgi:hypothetical protein
LRLANADSKTHCHSQFHRRCFWDYFVCRFSIYLEQNGLVFAAKAALQPACAILLFIKHYADNLGLAAYLPFVN